MQRHLSREDARHARGSHMNMFDLMQDKKKQRVTRGKDGVKQKPSLGSIAPSGEPVNKHNVRPLGADKSSR